MCDDTADFLAIIGTAKENKGRCRKHAAYKVEMRDGDKAWVVFACDDHIDEMLQKDDVWMWWVIPIDERGQLCQGSGKVAKAKATKRKRNQIGLQEPKAPDIE